MRKISVGIKVLFILLLIIPSGNSLGQQGTITQQGASGKISLDIKGMDILDVFRILSMRGGLNIISGKNVTGKVTLFLKDVDIWDAFEIIIAANGLAYEKRANIIYVMTERDYELNYGKKYEDKRVVRSVKLKHVKATDVAKSVAQLKTNIGRVVADETSDTIVLMDIPEVVEEMEGVIKSLDVSLVTKVYSLQYTTAETIKEKLADRLTKNVGSIQVDERTNKVAITDLERKMPMIEKVIEAFDAKHKEVLIEARILQITLNDDCKMGINWDGIFTTMRNQLHRLATVGVSLKYSEQDDIIPTTDSSVPGGALQIGALDSEGYEFVIQALKEYGQTNILSSPRIATLNNEEAKIMVGTNQPYATRSISQTSGDSSNIEAENVTFLDLGVKLYVTPTINEDGYITMNIKPEVSSSTNDYTIESSGNTIPIVKTTTTETTVMVKDNTTILIGGLIEEKTQENHKEIPGLRRIPILGNLFKSSTRGSGDSDPEKTELVIFLTPRIISGEGEDEMLTIRSMAHKDAMKKVEDNLMRLPDGTKAQDYYDLISTLIMEIVEKNRPSMPIYNEVVISFALNRYGRLISEPWVFKGDDEVLTDIGIKSIKEAAPFPAFPTSIEKRRETFQIAISYQ